MATQSSRKVFIDPSFLISFIDRSDLHHQKTVAIFELMAKQGYQIYTSSILVYQTFARVERDMGANIALDFLQAILDSTIKILYTTESELLYAYRFYKNSHQRQLNILELITARLMEKNGITYVLTYDYWHNVSGTMTSSLLNT
jgi:predicted nucleic acid-binding protein